MKLTEACAGGRSAFEERRVVARGARPGRARQRVHERLAEPLGQDAQRAIAFLKSMLSLVALAGKNGHPSRDDCARYLRMFAFEEAQATTFMKKGWQLTTPKPPKQKRGADSRLPAAGAANNPRAAARMHRLVLGPVDCSSRRAPRRTAPER